MTSQEQQSQSALLQDARRDLALEKYYLLSVMHRHPRGLDAVLSGPSPAITIRYRWRRYETALSR